MANTKTNQLSLLVPVHLLLGGHRLTVLESLDRESSRLLHHKKTIKVKIFVSGLSGPAAVGEQQQQQPAGQTGRVPARFQQDSQPGGLGGRFGPARLSHRPAGPVQH